MLVFFSPKVTDLLIDLPESQYIKFHNERMPFSVIYYLLKWSEPLTEQNGFLIGYFCRSQLYGLMMKKVLNKK